MTPQQEALNGQVSELDVIKNLQDKDQEIIDDLEGLKEGQKTLEDKVDVGFEKGRKRMDGIEGEMKELRADFKSFIGMFTNHVSRTEQMHQETKNSIQDHKYQDLQDEKKALKAQIEESKAKKWEILKMLGTGAVSLMVGGLGVYLFK